MIEKVVKLWFKLIFYLIACIGAYGTAMIFPSGNILLDISYYVMGFVFVTMVPLVLQYLKYVIAIKNMSAIIFSLLILLLLVLSNLISFIMASFNIALMVENVFAISNIQVMVAFITTSIVLFLIASIVYME